LICLLVVILIKSISTTMIKIKGDIMSPCGTPCLRKNFICKMATHENHCFSFIEEQCYPLDHVISKVQIFKGVFYEIVVDAIESLFKVNQ
jgi:hypothetical protein